MRSVARRLAVSAATVLLTCGVAAADPILLTTGGLVSPAGGVRIDFAGDGFSFSANADALGSGSLGPLSIGGAVPLDSIFGDMFGATATFNGRVFTGVIPIDFSGGLLTAPFQFNGRFMFDQFTGIPQILDLFVAGTASLMLRQNDFGGLDPSATISVTSVRFDLSPAAVGATPEPASMLLLGTGIVGLAARRRFTRKPE